MLNDVSINKIYRAIKDAGGLRPELIFWVRHEEFTVRLFSYDVDGNKIGAEVSMSLIEMFSDDATVGRKVDVIVQNHLEFYRSRA